MIVLCSSDWNIFKTNSFSPSHVVMDISGDIAFISFANGNRDKVSICAKDLSTGEVLMTYMGGTIARATLNLIGSRYLIAADEHKAVIYLWALNKMYPIKTIKAVGKISCLAVSNSSSVCVGSVDERLYVWMVHTGELIRSISYHCTRITCIKFSTSSMDFVSCDKHGSVVLWNATRLMSIDTKMGIQPIMTFTGHSAKITDAHLNETYLATCSLDKTVRVWFLRTGELYRCVDFEGAATCVSITPSLRHVLVGFNEARLSVIDIAKESRESDATFIVNSDIVCMGWTSEGVLLYGDERGTVGLLFSDLSYCDEVFTHNAGITNIVLTSFLPHGWNDASRSSLLEITPFSDKLCQDPVNLGAPINFHTTPTEGCSKRLRTFRAAESSEVKNDQSSISKNTDINRADETLRNDSTPRRSAKEQYSDVLNNLLLQ